MKKIGKCFSEISKEEIGKHQTAILIGVKSLGLSFGEGPTVPWPYLENGEVGIVSGSHNNGFIKIKLDKNTRFMSGFKLPYDIETTVKANFLRTFE